MLLLLLLKHHISICVRPIQPSNPQNILEPYFISLSLSLSLSPPLFFQGPAVAEILEEVLGPIDPGVTAGLIEVAKTLGKTGLQVIRARMVAASAPPLTGN